MIALALQAATAFNLICMGTTVTGPFSMALPRTDHPDREPYSVTYRVDLESGRYCTGDCVTTRYIAALSQTEITFHQEPAGDDGIGGSSAVSRETGRLTEVSLLGSLATLRSATCERAPFTGFPARLF